MLHVDPLSSFVVGTGKILDRHGPAMQIQDVHGCLDVAGYSRMSFIFLSRFVVSDGVERCPSCLL